MRIWEMLGSAADLDKPTDGVPMIWSGAFLANTWVPSASICAPQGKLDLDPLAPFCIQMRDRVEGNW